MRRLRLELKQTMDMYSSACKEAITAKQKVVVSLVGVALHIIFILPKTWDIIA